MTETYGVSVQVHVRQIVAPIGAGEARIPALVRLSDERLFLLYDERPAPASGMGADFNGLTMASDLPNPNKIRWMERTAAGEWSTPRGPSHDAARDYLRCLRGSGWRWLPAPCMRLERGASRLHGLARRW